MAHQMALKTPTQTKTLKLCYACFKQRFPNVRPLTATWAQQCSDCHKPTPGLALLYKATVLA